MTLPEQESFLKQRERLMREMESVISGERKRYKTVTELAQHSGFTRRTLYRMRKKWIAGGRSSGGLLHGRRGPKGSPYGKPPRDYERMIVRMHRRLGWSAPWIAAYLAEHNIVNPSSGRPLSQRACYNVLKRYPSPRKPRREEVVRYEKSEPGDLGHMDTKKLPNIKGENAKGKRYEAVLLDDATRLSYRELLVNKRAKTLVGFLRRALRWFWMRYRIRFEAILTDNGKEFTTHIRPARAFHVFEITLAAAGIKHRYTRPRRPQTNGKAEAFWKIWMRYVWTREFISWDDYLAHAERMLYGYNHLRRHGGIKHLTPYQKLSKLRLNEGSNETHWAA